MRPTGGLGGRVVEREGVLLRPPRPVSEGGAGVEELEEASVKVMRLCLDDMKIGERVIFSCARPQGHKGCHESHSKRWNEKRWLKIQWGKRRVRR